ncbi:MAG: NAD(+)/NADH kinase [Kiritimatiellae bacterium]|nr:NAD(+)/NADH kinase [Kiritimatiellia bacterium]
MKIGFYVNSAKAAAKAAQRPLAQKARALGLSVARDVRHADVVIALGGDGTILRAAHDLETASILGFNLGSLGYLSAVGEEDFDSALAMLAGGAFKVSGRTMLEVAKPGGGTFTALNDIVIMREMSGHAAILETKVNGAAATKFMADGLVVATPTGSTAYSLAAGGPVLLADSPVFALTPINPHALGTRSIVLNDDVRLSVTSRRRVNGVAEKIGVYADGESVFKLGVDESVAISKCGRMARFVELEGYDPYKVLSRKLGWNGGR